MRRSLIDLSVGVMMLVGAACLAYLSIYLARTDLGAGRTYHVRALFSNVGNLRRGAPVVIAGVEVGRVSSIRLVDYQGEVVMSIQDGVVVQEDAIAAIRTQGLIGEKYITISPGGADEVLGEGDELHDTQSAVDLEELIGKVAFGKVSE